MKHRACECCAVVEQIVRDLHDVVYRTPKSPQVFEELHQLLELARGAERHCRKVNRKCRVMFRERDRVAEDEAEGQLHFFDPITDIEKTCLQNVRAMADRHEVEQEYLNRGNKGQSEGKPPRS